jgi:hypothetical protein
MFTRFYDDPARIRKQLEQTTFIGRYMIDVPGAGNQLMFWEDPQIRMQKWGANLRQNTINIENDLFGMTRKLNRDLIDDNDFHKNAVITNEIQYGTMQPFIDESRASCPAWMFRTVEFNRWEFPIINPQANIEKKFNDNIQTRILEKDYFTPVYPNI